MTERRAFNDRELLASLICEKLKIPLEDQKQMTFYQVRSLVHGDHWPIPYANGGPTEFWNCTVLSIMKHRKKTAEFDIPNQAKNKRLRANEILRRYKEILKYEGPTAAAELYPAVERLLQRRKRKIAHRPFPKQSRPLQSRGFERRRT
jgi:hypothetical protein